MDIFFYIILFVIGSLFGSFYTLAVYRIPKRQDITHTHSYCPNCNHKLGILDLFPIFSYIFLGGKCRYCKQKIRPRYLILEILSGTVFVIFGLLLGLHYNTLTIENVAEYFFLALYFTFIVLISGIDKENKQIDKMVSMYGIVISIMYMLYLYIVEGANIYRYGIYLILYIIVLIFDTITLKRYAKNSYLTGTLLMLITMVVFTGEYVTASAILVTVLALAIYQLLEKLQEKKSTHKKEKSNNVKEKISIGFYLGLSNILILIFALFYNNYIW